MNNMDMPGRLKKLREYLIRTLKFYELKNERLTRAIFLIILAISFFSALIPDGSNLVIPANVAGVTIIFLVSTIYLAAFLRDLKGEEYDLGSCSKLVSKNLSKVIFSSITFLGTLLITLGIIVDFTITSILVLVLSIPLIIVYIMFLFSTCFIIDKQKGILESFRESRKITSGLKKQIFLKILGFNLYIGLPASLILASSASFSNILAANFVMSFVAAILNIMQQRLIALMYVDLEYSMYKA